MDIQVSSNFERLLFEASGRDAALVRALMGSLAAIRALRAAGRAARGGPRRFRRRARRRGGNRAAIRAGWREAGELFDPHTAVALAVADRDAMARGRVRTSSSRRRIPPNFPTRSKPPAACGPTLPAWLDGLMDKPESITPIANDQREIERFVRAASRAAKQGVARMSVEDHHPALGPHRRHRHHAASGDRGARRLDRRRRSRRTGERARHVASARAHGVQGHDDAAPSREIVEEIEAVGGDLNAATSTETTAYYARVLKADVPLALDVLSDILANPTFVPKNSSARKA